jgi:hypothetical protein
MPLTPEEASNLIVQHTAAACAELNNFTSEVLQTRGGRIGSGMGGIIEALWGFYLNRTLRNAGIQEIEIAWIYGHEYNDFACVFRDVEWVPETKEGELLRIEAKSMVASADESKAHFDRLIGELQESELLAVFLWDWVRIREGAPNVCPRVLDHFIGRASGVALLRDALHLNRGGSFVRPGECPDRCPGEICRHVGEPLNAAGIRERRTGPVASKGPNVSYSANFGGLLRMLGSRGVEGRRIIAEHRQQNPSAAAFTDFMGRNFARIERQLRGGQED